MPINRKASAAYRVLRKITPLRRAVRKIRTIIGLFRLPVWLLEGVERHSGQALRLFYAGNLEDKNYIAALMFADPYSDIARGHTWLWSAFLLARGSRTNHDLAIIDLEVSFARRFKGANAFLIPGWIRGEVDLDVAAGRRQKSKNVKSDLRKIRVGGYHYAVTKEEREFDRFYHEMYVPYAQHVYAGMTHLLSYPDMKKAIDQCELLLVKKDGIDVAGQVLLYEGSRVRAWMLGVKDGDPAYVRPGALAAVYYFMMQYLIERGYRNLHLGGSRPFLRDGVLQYKKKWGMQIVDGTAKWFVVRAAQHTTAVRSFFVNNPFFFETKSGLRGAIFIDRDLTIADEVVHEWRKDFRMFGMSHVQVFNFASAHEPQRDGKINSRGRLGSEVTQDS